MLLEIPTAVCFIIAVVSLMMCIVNMLICMSIGDRLRYYRIKFRDLLIMQNNKNNKLRLDLIALQNKLNKE